MKIHRLTAMLVALLLMAGLVGCSMASAKQDLNSAASSIRQAVDPTAGAAQAITKEQAQEIALKHAGFTADQVTRLRAEYEIDEGVPQYDVEFHEGGWEYEFEIHAETGAIISYDKDPER